jgi:hypothetical protein
MEKKRIILAKGTQEKLEAKAAAEGKTADELATEIILEKSAPVPVAEPTTAKPTETVKKRRGKFAEKKSETPEAEKSVFPAKGMVNAYGFLHLSNGVATAFGTPKGKKTAVTIDFKDGNLIISRLCN